VQRYNFISNPQSKTKEKLKKTAKNKCKEDNTEAEGGGYIIYIIYREERVSG
jgi:hypothetical protein